MDVIGKSVIRKEAGDKVTGRAGVSRDFVRTPQLDAPFGARGVGEHG